eukprot:1156170-Pelagomonas_calceolata.AAC.10
MQMCCNYSDALSPAAAAAVHVCVPKGERAEGAVRRRYLHMQSFFQLMQPITQEQLKEQQKARGRSFRA